MKKTFVYGAFESLRSNTREIHVRTCGVIDRYRPTTYIRLRIREKTYGDIRRQKYTHGYICPHEHKETLEYTYIHNIHLFI